jgi:hypothetical protein
LSEDDATLAGVARRGLEHDGLVTTTDGDGSTRARYGLVHGDRGACLTGAKDGAVGPATLASARLDDVDDLALARAAGVSLECPAGAAVSAHARDHGGHSSWVNSCQSDHFGSCGADDTAW